MPITYRQKSGEQITKYGTRSVRTIESREMHDPFAYEAKTRWVNPTTRPVAFRLMIEAGRHQPKPGTTGGTHAPARWAEVAIGPGDTCDIPSIFDAAIRLVDPISHRVESGLAPMLRVEGEANPPPLDPALLFRQAPGAGRRERARE